jgi:hypothetical protein
MKRHALTLLPLAALAAVLFGHQATSTGETPSIGPMPPAGGPPAGLLDAGDKKFEDFDKTVKGAKEHDGLFKLHHKDDKVYAEIRPDQFDKPLLAPIAIARGAGMGGLTLNFDEQWVLVFKRVGDRVQVIRRNVRFKAKPGSPEAKAVETTYTDSILLAVRIVSLNPARGSVVINLNDIFMTDFAQLGNGMQMLDHSRTTWHKVSAFPNSIELQVSATFGMPNIGMMMMPFGDDSVIDERGRTMVIHYGLVQLPESGYQPRIADDRVGYFLSATKDFSGDSRDTAFVRYVNRWRLERAEPLDPKNPNKLSAPKKKIVYWIEKSVPDEYRSYVREGILEWNKAFEKIGFRDAIEVRQQEDEDFDPEDIGHNTFRWITTGGAFAMGASRANPLTGELLDADIIFDADLVRFWKMEHQIMTNGKPTAVLDLPSPIQAVREGWGLLDKQLPGQDSAQGWSEAPERAKADPKALAARLRTLRQGMCQCASMQKYEMGMAALTMQARGEIKPGEKVSDELIGQAIKYVVMHEVGHTLGLRHNFKASTMLKNEQLHDTSITRKQGLVGSVMDYAPVNLAPKGVKQGDYYPTTIGPYDYWAIEYAYKPLQGGTEGEVAELQKIASKGATPGLDFGTDEDMMTADPLIHVFDLGADPMKFGQERMLLAQELLKELADKSVDNGEGYQRTRMAFSLLLSQYGNAAYLTSTFVGGEYVHRDHKGDPSGRDPFVPVTGAKQREALKFLQENVLSDKHFQFPPQLLRRLAADRWMHWGNDMVVFSGVEYPVYDRVLSIQRIVLSQMLNAGTLSRIQNNALKADKEEKPLTIAEVFRSVSDGVWGEKLSQSSIIRRNLQREHVKQLTNLVLGQQRGGFGGPGMMFFGPSATMPPDARSLARMHLREIDKKIEETLNDKSTILEDTTRAHLEECHERIAKVLSASMQVHEP